MTIGEARAKLEQNYQKHFKTVKTYRYTDKIKAVKYIQSQTGCEDKIAAQIVYEMINKKPATYNTTNKSNDKNNIIQKDIHQIATDLRFIKNLIIIGLILSIIIGILSGLGFAI